MWITRWGGVITWCKNSPRESKLVFIDKIRAEGGWRCQCCHIPGLVWMVIAACIKYRWELGVGVTKHNASVPGLPVELYFLFKGAEKSSKALSKTHQASSGTSSGLHHPGCSFVLQQEQPSCPARSSTYLHLMSLLSFLPSALLRREQRAFLQSTAEAKKSQTSDRVSPRSTPGRLLEGTLLPTWTGVNDGRQYGGIPELVCTILCFNWCYGISISPELRGCIMLAGEQSTSLLRAEIWDLGISSMLRVFEPSLNP